MESVAHNNTVLSLMVGFSHYKIGFKLLENFQELVRSIRKRSHEEMCLIQSML